MSADLLDRSIQSLQHPPLIYPLSCDGLARPKQHTRMRPTQHGMSGRQDFRAPCCRLVEGSLLSASQPLEDWCWMTDAMLDSSFSVCRKGLESGTT
jgi:hypothetical protein